MAATNLTAGELSWCTDTAWQGMQYWVSMFSGQSQLRHVDNALQRPQLGVGA